MIDVVNIKLIRRGERGRMDPFGNAPFLVNKSSADGGSTFVCHTEDDVRAAVENALKEFFVTPGGRIPKSVMENLEKADGMMAFGVPVNDLTKEELIAVFIEGDRAYKCCMLNMYPEVKDGH